MRLGGIVHGRVPAIGQPGDVPLQREEFLSGEVPLFEHHPPRRAAGRRDPKAARAVDDTQSFLISRLFWPSARRPKGVTRGPIEIH